MRGPMPTCGDSVGLGGYHRQPKSHWLPKRLKLRTSALGHPSQPHALIEPSALGEESRIITCYCVALEAADGKTWIKRKPHLRGGPCLVKRPKQRQGSSEVEMREREVAVCVDAP